MSTGRAWSILLLAALLAPTASASEALVAESFLLSGSMTLEGDAAALFFLLEDGSGIEWELTADAATLEREFLVEVALDNPLVPENYLYSKETDSGSETLELGAISASSMGGQVRGALLARSAEGTGTATATSSGLVEIAAVSDPTVAQFGESDVRAGEGVGIEETIEGDFLEVELSDGTLTLRGDLVIDLFGPSYAVRSSEGDAEHQTGEFETFRAGAAAEVRTERHLLTLTNAVVHVRAFQPITLYTRFTTVSVAGTLEAPGAEGSLDGVSPEDGSLVWSGDTRLALSAASGLVSASAPTPVLASGGAVIAQPQVPFLFATALALLALGGVALVALARRRGREDDLELALLAMEERRWHDALPRLARVAKRQPGNAGVQIDRALCLEQVGRYGEAAKAFEAALRTAPKHAEAHYYYARTLAKMQEKEAARAHLEAALERDPRLVEMMNAEAALRGL